MPSGGVSELGSFLLEIELIFIANRLGHWSLNLSVLYTYTTHLLHHKLVDVH